MQKLTAWVRSMFVKYKHIICYLFFGLITTVVNIGTYWLCYDILHIPNLISNVIAWITAVIVSFVTSKIWVFRSKTWTADIVIPEIIKFGGARLLTLLIDEVIMGVGVDLLHFNGLIMKLVSGVVVVILNYLFSRIWVFRKKDQV
ncbi:MAG: GtrA family protein [Lachnospiraceae bacterium]|nr:GtrA family protein [Lachnospiraceae bacterium]